jgi:glycosyltransferase involved in cell wall biosynthesis
VGDGAEAERLRERVRALRLQEAFEFRGTRHDVVDQLASFDIFVLPSFWEGHPIVLLEAMAAGLPVVASGIDGVREVLEDRRTGLLVPPADPMALAGAILELAADSGRAAQLGRAAAEAVASYDLARTVEAIGRVYREALGRDAG